MQYYLFVLHNINPIDLLNNYTYEQRQYLYAFVRYEIEQKEKENKKIEAEMRRKR